jgi:hypothetical protein
MATLEQIATALRRADQAGDVEAARRLAAAYRELQAKSRTEQAGFLESFRESALGLGKAPEAARFAAAEPGTDEARKAFLEANRPKKETTSFEEVKDLSSLADWAKQTAGTSAGYLVAPAAAATVGKMLTKAPGAAKALGYGTLGAQYLIENLGRQAAAQEEQIQRGEGPSETSLAKAGAAAAGQTALDAVGIKFFQPLFGRFPILRNLLGESGEKAAKEAEDALLESVRNQTLRGRTGILTGAAKGAAFEIPQEIAQSMLERAQAGLSLTDPDARREYYEAAAGAVLLGAPLGGMSRYYQNQAKIEEAQQIQFAREIEREEERQKAKVREKEEVEEKREAEKGTKKELREAKINEQLDAARSLLFGLTNPDGTPLTTETEPGQFERALISSGIPAKNADSLLRKLRRESVVTERNPVTGIRSLIPEAKQYDLTKGEEAATTTAPPPAAVTTAPPPAAVTTVPPPAAPPPAAPPPQGVTSDESTRVAVPAAGTTETDGGAGGAGAAQFVQSRGTERPATTTVADTGVVSADETTERPAVGKKPVKSSLDETKLEKWQARFEKTRSRFDEADPESPINLVNRINELKQRLLPKPKNKKAPQPIDEGLKYIFDIEDIVSYLRKGADLETVADKVGIDMPILEDYLSDLREAGVVTQDNNLNPDAFVARKTTTKTGEKGRTVESDYDRFLMQNETPILTAVRSLDDIVEKYDADGVIENTGDVRARIRERLDQIEQSIAAEGERVSAETEIELNEREIAAKQRADSRTESADQAAGMGPVVSGELSKANVSLKAVDQQVRDAVVQKDANKLLDTLYDLNTELGNAIPVGEAPAPQVERVKRVPKEMTKGQRAKLIRDLFEKTAATAEDTGVVQGRERPGVAISERGAAKRRIDVTKSLINTLRKVDLSDLTFELEGEPDVNVEAFDRMRNQNRLAEYDPQSNVIRLRTDGIKQKTLLHEMVHAVTVKVLRQYETNPDSLPENQREAAEHLNKIYALANKKLRTRYPNAFENVYEFVSYAMTDNAFQKDLSEMRSPNLAKYAVKAVKDLWTQFVESLMHMFDLVPLGDNEAQAQAEKAIALEREINDPNTSESKKNLLRQQLARIRRESIKTREGNLLLETAGAFEEIVSPPQKGVDVAPLAAKAAPPAEERGVAKIKREYRIKLDNKHPTEPAIRGAVKFLKTHEGSEWLIRKFQNDRRPLKTLQDALVRAGKLIVGEENFNNLYSLISLSSGNAFHVMTQYFQKDTHDVHEAIEAYAKANNINIMDALSDLNLYMIARHEPERRLIKFLRNVPLDDTKLITRFGLTTTAAKHRQKIFEMLRTNVKLTKDQALKLREFVEELAGYKDGKRVGNGSVDTTAGKSMDKRTKPGKYTDRIEDGAYNVAGEFTPSELESLRNAYQNDKQKVLIDRMIKAMDNIQKNTIEQDRRANYWSQPVDNIVNFYNFKNYVPLKGKPGQPETEDESEYNYTGKRLSGELAETPQSFEGRITDADNVIMQTLVDGAKSAMRAGRKDVTQAIKNLIDQGLIDGVNLNGGRKGKPIPFQDRESELERAKYKGDDKIYHYNPDGSVEVLKINDKKTLESIRRAYRDKSPFIDMANRITSGIGQFHTRYNPAFHPYNFVRDVLTNAFTLGAERGPEWTQRFLNNVTTRVAEGGMAKAAKVSKLYADGDVGEIEKLAKTDPFVGSILEYLREGGRVSYVQGLAIRGQIDELVRDINRGKWVRGKEKVDRWVDIWTDMFELTSRAAAYETAKAEALARGVPERAARQEGAAYAKNLANFEQVGEWGRQAGALFMFFRPAATGAIRAIDALTPAFQDVQTAVDRLPEAIRKDPVAVNQFKANFMKEKKNAQAMALGLLGAGFTLYVMAFMAADDDELGRNKVATEDMSLWTRNLRLPLEFLGIKNLKDNYLQVPWGFGLGSFLAMGAQVGGMAIGNSSLSDGLANATTIALDSFLPLPVARFNPANNFPAWMLDSLAPSLVRPFLEYTMNVDTFGREIYNNRLSRYGDAYTGGRNVPELYNQAARKLFEATNAQVDVSPNTMYFFTNNYVDGLSRIIHNGHGMFLMLAGNKEFDIKRDLIFMDSFFGRKSSFDARQFAKVEQSIQEKEQRLRTVKDRPELLQRYLESNPNDPALVYIYNKLKNQQLKVIREEMNKVKAADLTAKERQERLKKLEFARDMTMRSIIDTFKQYGLEP